MERESIINPYDLSGTKRETSRLKTALGFAAAPFGLSVDDFVTPALESAEKELMYRRGMYLVASIPVIGLGLYVGYVTTEFQLTDRSVEIAMMRTRGARTSQVRLTLLTESALKGLLAGVLGLGLSFLLATFIIRSQICVEEGGCPVTPAVSFQTFLLSMLLGIGLMMLSSFRTGRFDRTTPPALQLRRALHEEPSYQAEGRVEKSLLAGIVVFLIGVFLLGPSIFFGHPDISLVFALIPLLVMVASLRLVFLRRAKILERIAIATKPFMGRMWKLSGRNLVERSQETSRMVILVAIAVSFGFLIVSVQSSQANYQELIAQAKIGGDILLEVRGWNESTEDKLASFDGVRCAVGLIPMPGSYPITIATDPTKYLQCVDLRSELFSSGDPKESLLSLDEPGTAIISKSAADSLQIVSGEVMQLGLPVLPPGESSDTIFLPFRVVAVARYLPGVDNPYRPPPDFAFISLEALDPTVRRDAMNQVTRPPEGSLFYYIVGVKDGYEESEVVSEISQKGIGLPGVWIENLWLRSDISKAGTVELSGIELLPFLSIQSTFTNLLVATGIAAVLATSFAVRKNEFTAMIARGCGRRHLAASLGGEGMIIVLLGLLSGMAAGLLSGLALVVIYSESSGLILPMEFILPQEVWNFVFWTVGIFGIAILLAVLAVAKADLPSYLRLRWG